MKSHAVGLIGFGLAGRSFHAPLIAATPGLKLVAVVSSQVSHIKKWYPGVRVYPTVDSLTADRSIELIVVASPDEFHAEHACSAMASGKHVVIDKPIAPTLSEACAIAAAADSHDRLVGVFHNRRWDADFLTLRSLIGEGVLGEIRLLESRFDRFRPDLGDRWKDRRAGGVWQDIGPHLVDQAIVLFGLPAAVWADLTSLKDESQSVDHAHVVLRYPDRRVTLHISQSVPENSLRFAAHGARASYVKRGLDPQENQSKAGLWPKDPEWGLDPIDGELFFPDGTRRLVANHRGNYPAFYRQVALALAGIGPMPAPISEAMQTMVLIDLAQQSTDMRCEISLTQPRHKHADR